MVHRVVFVWSEDGEVGKLALGRGGPCLRIAGPFITMQWGESSVWGVSDVDERRDEGAVSLSEPAYELHRECRWPVLIALLCPLCDDAARRLEKSRRGVLLFRWSS